MGAVCFLFGHVAGVVGLRDRQMGDQGPGSFDGLGDLRRPIGGRTVAL